MAGTTWPTLVANARAKASEVEAKFDWIEQDLVPMAGGSKADATYDLGQSTFRWRDAYVSRQWLGPFGSVGAPSFSYQSRTTDGWYSPASNQQGLALGGAAWLTHRDNSGTTYTDGGQSWTHGIDPADSNAWKISIGGDLATVTAERISVAGEITHPFQVSFLAYVNSQTSIVAASATITAFQTEAFDNNSDFSTSVFTAPVTGKYYFDASIEFGNLPTQSVAQLIITTNTREYVDWFRTDRSSTTSTRTSVRITAYADMTIGDRAYVRHVLDTISSSTINGGTSAISSRFQGFLVA